MKNEKKSSLLVIWEYFLKQVANCSEIKETAENSLNLDSEYSIKPRVVHNLLNYPTLFILTASSGTTSNLDMQAVESTIIMKLQWTVEWTYLQKVVVIYTKISASIITHGQVLKEVFYVSTKLFLDFIVVLYGFRNNIHWSSQFVWIMFIYLGIIAVHKLVLR